MAERAAGTFARDILNRFLIDLSWASSRLEGNTYSRQFDERLIEFGQEAAGKDAKETQMILNHKAAIGVLVEENGDDIGINRYTCMRCFSENQESLTRSIGKSCTATRLKSGASVYTPPGTITASRGVSGSHHFEGRADWRSI